MAIVPRSGDSFATRVLEGTTLTLKVAREATDSVSIVKQILGSAAHISEFAEVCWSYTHAEKDSRKRAEN